MFAAVVGRSLKAIAAFRLEKGASIRLLKQLVGSKTVISAITSPFKLRALNVLTPILVLLWVLSPVGSQAALKVVAKVDVNSISSLPLFYLDSQTPFSIIGASSAASYVTPINGVFTSALMAPHSSKIAPQDAWQNVKIPMLESLLGAQVDNGTWQLTENATEFAYSALVGRCPLFSHRN